jgi:hypothetical protein
MLRKRHSLTVLLAAIAFSMVGCGEDEPTGLNGETTFHAVAAGPGEACLLEVTVHIAMALRVAAPGWTGTPVGADLHDADGTLTDIEGGDVIDMDGKYLTEGDETVGGELTLAGGGYDLTGTIQADGQMSGTYTGPGGDGVFAGFPGTEFTVYCGHFTSNLEEREDGRWMLVERANEFVGAFSLVAGSARPTILIGSLVGSNVELTFPGGSAIGTFLTDSWNGTWRYDDLSDSGHWWATVAECTAGTT